MTDFTKTIEHIKVLEGADGPKWYEWCDLATGYILIDQDVGEPSCSACGSWVRNPPACHAAIITWCGEVRFWWASLDISNISNAFPMDGHWHAMIDIGSYLPMADNTQLAACLALIEAVAGRLGEE